MRWSSLTYILFVLDFDIIAFQKTDIEMIYFKKLRLKDLIGYENDILKLGLKELTLFGW